MKLHHLRPRTRFVATAAIIAALYAVLTIVFAPISYGEIQVRISEALTILPLFTPAAIPGLFVGCLLANLFTMNPYDIVFGSLATLLASFLTWKMRKWPWFAMAWPVLCNGVIIGIVLRYAYQVPISVGLLMLYVAVGEAIAVYVLGGPLSIFLRKKGGKLFPPHTPKQIIDK